MMCLTVGTTKCRCGKNKGEDMGCVTRHSLVRKLFSDHAWYTLEYITAVIAKLRTAPALRVRLLDNQAEIGRELGSKFPAVGTKNGKAVGDLLTAHIAKAETVVVAAINGNEMKLEQAKVDLFNQGDNMSDVLADVLGLNAADVRAEFRMHNQHVLNLATMLLTNVVDKRYIDENDKYQNHMLRLADTIYMAARNLDADFLAEPESE